MNEIKASNFPAVYEGLAIDPGDLGCIMLDVEPIVISDVVKPEDLYYKLDDPDSHTQGNVSENEPHLTLLYGLMQEGELLKRYVDMLLSGWEPGDVEIDKVDFFYSNDPEHPDYVTIIARIKVTGNLLEGNARIRMLPHIDTFPEYHPHVTLAYVKDSSSWKAHIKMLNDKYAGKKLKVVGLNYGD